MKKVFLYIIMFLMVAAFVSAIDIDEQMRGINGIPEKSYKTRDTLYFLEDKIIIKYTYTKESKAISSTEDIKQLRKKYSFKSAQSTFKKMKKNGLQRIYTIKLQPGDSPLEMCRQLENDPDIQYAEPVYNYSIQFTPDDTYYQSTGSWGQACGDMWGLHAINPETVWDQTRGEGIIVAVIDTGVDYNHEDLYRDVNNNQNLDVGEQYNIWINPAEDINGNGIVDPEDYNNQDDDNNGYIDDLYGWNFISNNKETIDDNGHGTHCAGIIAAISDNKGIIGVAPRAKVMIIKGLDEAGDGTSEQLANAIIYAVDNGAGILSCSWGGFGDSKLITDAIDYARTYDRVVIAAAGNDSAHASFFMPANINGVITVGALDPQLSKASFSNFGSPVDVCAPGVDILSLRAYGTDMYNDGNHFVPPGDSGAKYYRSNGTSMACPYVSGVAALILAENPATPETRIRRMMTESTQPINTTNFYLGTGLIDAVGSVNNNTIADVDAGFSNPIDDTEGLSIQSNESVRITGTADGDSYILEYGEGYYPEIWHTINSGSRVIDNELGILNISNLNGPYHIRLHVFDDEYQATEHMVFRAEPDLHPGWPVKLGGAMIPFGGFILGETYTSTPADIDNDGSAEIFIGTSRLTFGLKGDGSFLSGWPTQQSGNLSYGTNDSYPGPSIADIDNDGEKEILWTLRDCDEFRCFNAKKPDGTNIPGFPKGAIDDYSNAFHLPFVLADIDGNSTLEALSAHTKGNNAENYRISVFNHTGERLFTIDLPDENETIAALSYGNLDGIQNNEIIAISAPGYQNVPVHAYAYDNNGNILPGYPFVLTTLTGTDTLAGTPFFVDMDDDGDLEIILGKTGYQGYMYCFHHDGTIYNGFPIMVGNQNQLFYYCMGDINNDDEYEIIVTTKKRPADYYEIYAFSLYGELFENFPFTLDEWPSGVPAIVDVDNNGTQDICFTTYSGSLYAVSNDAAPVINYPKQMSYSSLSGVSVSDVDGDNLYELISANMMGRVYVWDLAVPAIPGNSDWPMRHIDPLNTSIFTLKKNSTHLGDVNNDGNINIIDALLTAQHYVGLNPQNFDIDNGDVNCNNSVTIIDALLIAQYYVGLIQEFC